MDRPTTRTDADPRGPRIAPRDAFVLPSRRTALDACRSAIEAGPVLLTGDAGSGKTWLWRTIGAGSPPGRRWVGVDLTPADEPADFYCLIARELGLSDASRITLVDFLADRHDDGDRPVLVVEEAHNLSLGLWEEVRILANRLGEPGGFAGLVLVGQTPLARKFSTRALAAIDARVAARAHLGPIDADEAQALLGHLRAGRAWTLDEVEALHRDAAGNPGRILRSAGREPIRAVPAPTPDPVRAAPLLGPTRPPLISEDHLIEVGWSPEDEPIGQTEPGPAAAPEEEVRDHLAALQAWREWSENQSRRGLSPTEAIEPETIEPELEPEAIEPETPSPLADRPTLWADGERPFAPYGQLFSRLTQAREPD